MEDIHNEKDRKLLFVGIVMHKPCIDPRIPYHHPICAGAMKNIVKFSHPILRDDEIGGGISSKNPHYNELTVQYYMWQTNMQADYIGLCHYRRFFNFNMSSVSTHPRVSTVSLKNVNKSRFGWDDKHIQRLFTEDIADIYVCRPERDVKPGVKSIYENHRWMGTSEVDDDIINCVKEYDSKYEFYAKAYFDQFNKHMFNMYIMKKELFSEYSKWLFGVLEIYERLQKSKDKFIERSCGFAGEHLLNIWLLYQKRLGVQVRTLQSVYVNLTDEKTSWKSILIAYGKFVFDLFFPYNTKRRDKIKWKFFMNV